MGKHRILLCIAYLFFLLALWGCAGTGPGPQAWIDFPLNNDSFPLAPLNIMAHASHTQGVASIEFYVDGEQINAVAVGGSNLEDASVEWNPFQPGRYRIEVRGLDAAGSAGSYAASVITIGGSPSDADVSPSLTETSPGTVSATFTSGTPTGTITLTATQPTGTFTLTATDPTITNTPQTPQPPVGPAVTADMDANCRYGPSNLFDVYAYLLQGQQADLTGRLADNSWFLVVPPGSSSSCFISASIVSVQGDLDTVQVVKPPEQPITDTPTLTLTTTPTETTPPPPDTSPPDILSTGLDPDEIMKVGQGCDSYARTSVSTVNAQDNVSVASVSASWVLRDTSNNIVASGNVNYSSAGGNTYQAVFGPVNYDGTMSIDGTVLDSSGNSSQFSQQITVIACIG